MTRHVALYCRLSPRPDGSYEGVADQERWGRDYAASAWPDLSVLVFSDEGISAANGDRRPGFEDLRAALAAGEIAHLWCVEQSRLERTEVGWFTLAAELDAAGITEVHTNRDGIVRVRDEVAGIKAVINAGEVRKLKRRINDRLAALAADGIPPGSRPFGYRHGLDETGRRTYVVVPEQAEVIRDAADKVLSGWSLTSIAKDLVARGLLGAHGGKITQATVRAMLTNPTVAGQRTHQERVIGRGNWPAILDETTWHAVRAKLSAPRVVAKVDGGAYPVRVLDRRGRTARKYLLTGYVFCGVCGAPLVGSVKQFRGGRTAPYYYCSPNRGGRSCLGIMAEPVERHVAALLAAELDKPAFLEALAADDHAARRDELVAQLGKAQRQRSDLAAMWGAGELTGDEWRTARRSLAENEQRLQAALAAIPAPVTRVDPAAIAAAWPLMTLDEQREQIGMFIERVTISRAKPPYNKVDVGRVAVDWRTVHG